MRADRSLLLLLAALTAGCAAPEPFVDQGDPTFTVHVEKPRDTVLETGLVALCFSDATPWGEVEQLARERCSAHGLLPMLYQIQRQQCRLTSPHRATFRCYDPEMTTATGTPINPFDPRAVQTWEKRTGKTAKAHNFLTVPGGPASNPAAPPAAPTPDAIPQTAPSAAPLAAPAQAPLAPLTPEGIAGRPAYQPYPPRPAASAPSAPPAEAYPPGNFSLPQGSWGDAFQE